MPIVLTAAAGQNFNYVDRNGNEGKIFVPSLHDLMWKDGAQPLLKDYIPFLKGFNEIVGGTCKSKVRDVKGKQLKPNALYPYTHGYVYDFPYQPGRIIFPAAIVEKPMEDIPGLKEFIRKTGLPPLSSNSQEGNACGFYYGGEGMYCKRRKYIRTKDWTVEVRMECSIRISKDKKGYTLEEFGYCFFNLDDVYGDFGAKSFDTASKFGVLDIVHDMATS